MMIVGIDPGLVHTGCVRVIIDNSDRTVMHEHCLVDGPDAGSVRDWVMRFGVEPDLITVEQYRPRRVYDSDSRMVKAVTDMVKALPGSRALENTGVKKLAPRWLLDIFGVGKFSEGSHHQDLQAAARIMYMGAVKNPEGNKVLTAVVSGFLDGRPWRIIDISDWADGKLEDE